MVLPKTIELKCIFRLPGVYEYVDFHFSSWFLNHIWPFSLLCDLVTWFSLDTLPAQIISFSFALSLSLSSLPPSPFLSVSSF